MKRLTRWGRLTSTLLGICLLLIVPSITADSGANHQDSSNDYGVSGGNVNDITRRFCCSGTLGSLLQDAGGTKYILSNNHVLGLAGRAKVGDDISQPGLIDNNCQVAAVVADFTAAPPLSSNVDAAIGELRANTMNTTGAILDIGTISSNVKAPSVGLAVSKSGRTTGLTNGTVNSTNTTVSVRYPKSCGSGGGTLFTFTNQLVITGSGGNFSAGGDSGSLIVTNNSCRQPVGLLFAGSSSSTIGNPIGQVLTNVSSALGSTVSFVGGTCSAASSGIGLMPEISLESINYAIKAKNGREAELMARPGVVGVGIGASVSDPTAAAIMIYVDQTKGVMPELPNRIKGVAVQVVLTDPFVAY